MKGKGERVENLKGSKWKREEEGKREGPHRTQWKIYIGGKRQGRTVTRKLQIRADGS